MITKRQKALQWWQKLTLKMKESYMRLLAYEYRTWDSLTGREIEGLYDIHLTELEVAALEYYKENIEGEPLSEDIVIECFIAGCEHILNK